MRIEQTVVGESWEKRPSSRPRTLLQTLKKSNTPMTIIPDDVMDELVNGRSLGSILSLIKLPQLPTIFELTAATDSPLFLVAVDVVDPGNVGAMVRTAHGVWLHGFGHSGRQRPLSPKSRAQQYGQHF